jgi:hypothetical protein
MGKTCGGLYCREMEALSKNLRHCSAYTSCTLIILCTYNLINNESNILYITAND